MTRTIHLYDGRTFDTSDMTQEQELAYLRNQLGKHYAQFVARVELEFTGRVPTDRKLDLG